MHYSESDPFCDEKLLFHTILYFKKSSVTFISRVSKYVVVFVLRVYDLGLIVA